MWVLCKFCAIFLLRTWAVDFCIHGVLETTAHGYQETSTFPFCNAFSSYQTVLKAGCLRTTEQSGVETLGFSPYWLTVFLLRTKRLYYQLHHAQKRSCVSLEDNYTLWVPILNSIQNQQKVPFKPHCLCSHSSTVCHRISQITDPMNGRH